jgi:O-acetyl-ADP-ribose deacetylase (regulator of RNase III)
MKWTIKAGNILDESGDVLVVSANVGLNLSGGVSGDLLARYGPDMQRALHDYLYDHKLQLVQPGEVIPYSGAGLPHQAVLHAVAVDGFYQSTPARAQQVVRVALQMAAGKYQAQKVLLTALATGNGNLTLAEFGEALRPLVLENFGTVEEVCICLRGADRAQELARAFPEAAVVG